jgi:probable FeS assembly SUF system protein SufT
MADHPTGPITLARDCEAVQIPFGAKVMLPAGSQVTIQQSLGGTWTVFTDEGQMVRIAGKDADALGLEAQAAAPVLPAGAQAGPPDVERMVWSQLRTVYDPEIPVNVVDLGLIYAMAVKPLADGLHRVEVTMTLTAPGCGMGDVLRSDAEQKIQGIPGVEEVDVKLVVDPPWDRSRMSEAAKLQLGFL